MKDYIINSFILQDKKTLKDIYNYIKCRYDKSVELNDIKTELTKLIKNNIICFHKKTYELSTEGNVILNDYKYYYSRIISRFLKKNNNFRKKYEVKEVRQEQQYLRNYLISNKKHMCVICDKKLPLCLLETAHLKPRYILNNIERKDKNIVEIMCRYCHNLYDNGFLAIYKGLLQVSTIIDQYDLIYYKNKQIDSYNLQNEKYFIYHYNYIYKMSV